MPSPGNELRALRVAGSDPDDLGIRRRDGDGSDRQLVLTIEHWRERHAAVCGLEHTASPGGHVERVEMLSGRTIRDGDGRGARLHPERADVPT